MTDTGYVDVEKVETLRVQRGSPQIKWMCEQLGLSRTAGYSLFTHGILPKDDTRAKEVLEKLSELLGAEGPASLLRPTARTA